jgi:hypothetical protein
MKKNLVLILTLFLFAEMAHAQKVMDLYPNKVPNSKKVATYQEESTTSADGTVRIAKVVKPTLTAYFPEKPNGTSIIICPGGGYARLAITHV